MELDLKDRVRIVAGIVMTLLIAVIASSLVLNGASRDFSGNPASIVGVLRDFSLQTEAQKIAAANLGHRSLDALVGVADDQLDPAQTASRQLAQKLGPDRFSLGCADFQAQNLAPTVGIDPDRDDDGDRDDPPAAPDLEVGGVDPQVGPIPLKRAGEEGFHLAVDLFAEPRDLALADPRHAHRLDQIIDGTR